MNQYDTIANPRSLDVLVRAPEETISVASTGNTVTYDDQEDYDFHRAQIASSSNNAQMVPVNVTAGSLTTQGKLWLPAAEESPWHDADGNLVSEDSVLDGGNHTATGRWECAWDGENRLVSMRPTQAALTAGAPNIGLDFSYDHRSRRISKKVLDLANSNAVITDLRFAWDDWNMVAEFTNKGGTGGPPVFSLIRSYTWGPDLSNTLQGAGGVGGLLEVTVHSTSSATYYPAMDGNGNIIAWSDSAGATRRRIDYAPFGAVVTVEDSETVMPAIPLGFSTKYTDPETGLVYYVFRYLDTLKGRWRSMDPIGEGGGANLYGFVANKVVDGIDAMGLVVVACPIDEYLNENGVFGWKKEEVSVSGGTRYRYSGAPSSGTGLTGEILQRMIGTTRSYQIEDGLLTHLKEHVADRIRVVNNTRPLAERLWFAGTNPKAEEIPPDLSGIPNWKAKRNQILASPENFGVGCRVARSVAMGAHAPKTAHPRNGLTQILTPDTRDWIPGDAGYIENTNWEIRGKGTGEPGQEGENIIYVGNGLFYGHTGSMNRQERFRSGNDWFKHVNESFRDKHGASTDPDRESWMIGIEAWSNGDGPTLTPIQNADKMTRK